ncbi:hypothetical protein GLOIN_2v1873676 [Rhizophagus clarus]|uniref:Uncharacterized protein n=1 Tax=Rhizophagus clarus TaxID=94130 RepID=A0A8H3L066_9GLOM|nr:hypothetical protein GLOIN_2v1873676 [Rhizophagus clarus]
MDYECLSFKDNFTNQTDFIVLQPKREVYLKWQLPSPQSTADLIGRRKIKDSVNPFMIFKFNCISAIRNSQNFIMDTSEKEIFKTAAAIWNSAEENVKDEYRKLSRDVKILQNDIGNYADENNMDNKDNKKCVNEIISRYVKGTELIPYEQLAINKSDEFKGDPENPSYDFIFIDTPGMSDTNGMEQDEFKDISFHYPSCPGRPVLNDDGNLVDSLENGEPTIDDSLELYNKVIDEGEISFVIRWDHKIVNVFYKMYRGILFSKWNNKKQNWKRINNNMLVALNNYKNIASKELNKVFYEIPSKCKHKAKAFELCRNATYLSDVLISNMIIVSNMIILNLLMTYYYKLCKLRDRSFIDDLGLSKYDFKYFSDTGNFGKAYRANRKKSAIESIRRQNKLEASDRNRRNRIILRKRLIIGSQLLIFLAKLEYHPYFEFM